VAAAGHNPTAVIGVGGGVEAAGSGGLEVISGIVFDPGIPSPEAYLQQYLSKEASSISPIRTAVLDFACRLKVRGRTGTWPLVEERRRLWNPPSPLPCLGSEIAVDPGVVRANYDSWSDPGYSG
jgi:hypothetical protein